MTTGAPYVFGIRAIVVEVEEPRRAGVALAERRTPVATTSARFAFARSTTIFDSRDEYLTARLAALDHVSAALFVPRPCAVARVEQFFPLGVGGYAPVGPPVIVGSIVFHVEDFLAIDEAIATILLVVAIFGEFARALAVLVRSPAIHHLLLHLAPCEAVAMLLRFGGSDVARSPHSARWQAHIYTVVTIDILNLRVSDSRAHRSRQRHYHSLHRSPNVVLVFADAKLMPRCETAKDGGRLLPISSSAYIL